MPKPYTSLADVALPPSSTSGACQDGWQGRASNQQPPWGCIWPSCGPTQHACDVLVLLPRQFCPLCCPPRPTAAALASAAQAALTAQMGLLRPAAVMLLSGRAPTRILDRLKSDVGQVIMAGALVDSSRMALWPYQVPECTSKQAAWLTGQRSTHLPP